MKPTIIRAGASHLDLLTPLFDGYRQSYGRESNVTAARKFLSQRLDNNDSALLLAMDAAMQLGVGFTQLYPSFSSVSMQPIWILNDLFVDENKRGSGVGRLLIESAMQLAVASGAVRIDLATAKDNAQAKRLYEATGFKVDTVFDHYKLAIN